MITNLYFGYKNSNNTGFKHGLSWWKSYSKRKNQNFVADSPKISKIFGVLKNSIMSWKCIAFSGSRKSLIFAIFVTWNFWHFLFSQFSSILEFFSRVAQIECRRFFGYAVSKNLLWVAFSQRKCVFAPLKGLIKSLKLLKMPYELDEIKKIRKKIGLTQTGLANRAGVSQSLIAKIESGRIDPTYTKTQKIFAALSDLEKKDEVKAWARNPNVDVILWDVFQQNEQELFSCSF